MIPSVGYVGEWIIYIGHHEGFHVLSQTMVLSLKYVCVKIVSYYHCTTNIHLYFFAQYSVIQRILFIFPNIIKV